MMELKTEMRRVRRELEDLLRAEPRCAASTPAAFSNEQLFVFVAALRFALTKDPTNPRDRVHRRVHAARDILELLMQRLETPGTEDRLEAAGLRLQRLGLGPHNRSDVLRFLRKELKDEQRPD